MLCTFQMGEDRIYYNVDTQEIVMVGSLGEDRISLQQKLQGQKPSEQELIIMANFIYCVQQYAYLQLGPIDTPNAETNLYSVEFEYDPDSKLVETADPTRNGPKKKEEMN